MGRPNLIYFVADPANQTFLMTDHDNADFSVLANTEKGIPFETKRESTHLLLFFQNKIGTSMPSQGTGLGLVTCRSILENCHGIVKWSKEGDEFKLWLLVPVEG